MGSCLGSRVQFVFGSLQHKPVLAQIKDLECRHKRERHCRTVGGIATLCVKMQCDLLPHMIVYVHWRTSHVLTFPMWAAHHGQRS